MRAATSGGTGGVDVQDPDGLAGALARDAELQARDVDAGVAEDRADPAHHARLIEVARDQEMAFGDRVEQELVELDHAEVPAADERAGRGVTLGADDDLDAHEVHEVLLEHGALRGHGDLPRAFAMRSALTGVTSSEEPGRSAPTSAATRIGRWLLSPTSPCVWMRTSRSAPG